MVTVCGSYLTDLGMIERCRRLRERLVPTRHR